MVDTVSNNQSPPPKLERLDDRTFNFAQNCRDLIKLLNKNVTNIEYAKQLARSSGSVAANYIEANDSLSKKDFIMRLRIARKEAKESRLWLRLLEVAPQNESSKEKMIDEASQIIKILSAIIDKTS